MDPVDPWGKARPGAWPCSSDERHGHSPKHGHLEDHGT